MRAICARWMCPPHELIIGAGAQDIGCILKMLQLARGFCLLRCLGREALSVSPQLQEEAARYV